MTKRTATAKNASAKKTKSKKTSTTNPTNSEPNLMRVLLLRQPDGDVSVVTDGACEIIEVSTHTPGDRLYRFTTNHVVDHRIVDAIIHGDQIGYRGDGSLAEQIAEVIVEAKAAISN